VNLLKGIVLGSVLISASQIFVQQAFAEEDTASEIRLLKAKLKQLEQRVESQGRKEKEYEAQAKAISKRRRPTRQRHRLSIHVPPARSATRASR